jgi:tetratricopeptide (TPR) repeat protein
MKFFGFSDSFKIGDVEYYVETDYSPEREVITTKILKDGNIVYYKKQKVSRELSEEKILEILKDFHIDTLREYKGWGEISEKFIKGAPVEIHVKMAEKLMKMGLLTEAEKHLQKAIEIDKDYSPIYKNYAILYFIKGEYSKAFNYIAKALEISPNYPDYYLLMGKILIKLSKEKESLTFINEAIKRVPSYSEAHYEEVKAFLSLMIKGISIEREKVMAKLKLLPIMDPRLNSQEYKEALLHFEKNEYKECLAKLEEMEKIFYYNYPQEIIRDFALLSKADATTPLTLREYILRLEALIEKNKDYPDIYFALSKSYLLFIKELFEKSHYYLKKSIDLNPHYIEAKKILELLENEIKGFLIFLKAIER